MDLHELLRTRTEVILPRSLRLGRNTIQKLFRVSEFLDFWRTYVSRATVNLIVSWRIASHPSHFENLGLNVNNQVLRCNSFWFAFLQVFAVPLDQIRQSVQWLMTVNFRMMKIQRRNTAGIGPRSRPFSCTNLSAPSKSPTTLMFIVERNSRSKSTCQRSACRYVYEYDLCVD